jgi:steryl-sulfatase
VQFIRLRSFEPHTPFFFFMSYASCTRTSACAREEHAHTHAHAHACLDDHARLIGRYFHVHTPLFTMRANAGRSRGGAFGDAVEELDDSVGRIVAALAAHSFEDNTLIFWTSDNGPYQEEGWGSSGRTNLWSADGRLLGRMKGGKGQVYEGGIRMPAAVVWPRYVRAGAVSSTFVSTLDIVATAIDVANITLDAGYAMDGRSMLPILLERTHISQHDVFFHYCGFNVLAARVWGRWKVFWAMQRWYTYQPLNASVCVQCCNGINPVSKLFGTPASELCGCAGDALETLSVPIVYDMLSDPLEANALTSTNWPGSTNTTFSAVVQRANDAKAAMERELHPKPDAFGAGTCTAGLPSHSRQPCCPGCHQAPLKSFCQDLHGAKCNCSRPP